MLILGAVLVVALVVLIGAFAASKVHNTEDFTVAGRRLSMGGVAGVIMGALVGGASTVGTAQAAYVYGLGGWWFTLAAGAGCIVLGAGFARCYRNANLETLPQFLMQSYGSTMRPIIAVLDSLGMFLSVPTQLVSAVALLAVLLHWPIPAAAALSVILAFLYTLGGTRSAGAAGVFKIVVFVAAELMLAFTAISLSGGLPGLFAKLPIHPFLQLTGNGTSKDIANAISVIIGLLASQYSLQAVVSARNIRLSMAGAFISGILTALFGFGGVLAGMYMRVHFPHIKPVLAMPLFIHALFPPFVAGLMLGALLIVVISCAAGLILGCSILFARDIYQVYIRPHASDSELLVFSRILIVALAALGAWVGLSRGNILLVQWNFLSLGLRGTTSLLPLLAAVLFPRWIKPLSGVVAATTGPIVTILWFLLFPHRFDPVYAGLIGALVAFLVTNSIAPRTLVGAAHTPGGSS
ncbi:MAG: sodium:solute symporter family protein [Vulcanimicrobiaceae bacterium]